MKAYLLIIALAVIPACGKKNDVATLQSEAVTLAKYYRPKIEALQKRVDAIFARGKSIPGNLPGIEDVGRRLQEARDTLAQLRSVVGPDADQKSIEKQAEAAAKEGNAVNLKKLIHEAEDAIDNGLTVVNDDLDSVESWIANYDRKTLAMTAPPAGSAAEPGTPENANTPATGQPPAAPQPQAPRPEPQAGSAQQPTPPKQ